MRAFFCLLYSFSLACAHAATPQGSGSSHTTLGIEGGRFTINGEPRFLYGISYYGAIGAPDQIILRDLEEMQQNRFNWIRVWANWTGFGAQAAAVDGEGRAVPSGLDKLRWLVSE